jgi:hypothetical protein
MQDDANVPVPVVAPAPPITPSGRRTSLLLGVGGAVGLALGVLLSIGVYSTYTVFTQTVPSTVESLQVFNELNEMRQQINQLNEEKKLKDKEAEEAMQKALSNVTSALPSQTSPASESVPVAKARPRKPPGVDPFADIDAEIEDLERTQKTLNTILDLFSRKSKEAPKESPGKKS